MLVTCSSSGIVFSRCCSCSDSERERAAALAVSCLMEGPVEESLVLAVVAFWGGVGGVISASYDWIVCVFSLCGHKIT